MSKKRFYNLLIKVIFIFSIGFFIRLFVNNWSLDFLSCFYFILFLPQLCFNFIISISDFKLYLNYISDNEHNLSKKVYLLLRKSGCFGNKTSSNSTNPILGKNYSNIVRESVARSNRTSDLHVDIINKCRRRVY